MKTVLIAMALGSVALFGVAYDVHEREIRSLAEIEQAEQVRVAALEKAQEETRQKERRRAKVDKDLAHCIMLDASGGPFFRSTRVECDELYREVSTVRHLSEVRR